MMWYNLCPSRFHLPIFAFLIYSASYHSLTLYQRCLLSGVEPCLYLSAWHANWFVSVLERIMFRKSIKNISNAGTLLSYLGFYEVLTFSITVCMVAAVVFVWLYVPETRGRELEFTDLLFMKRRERRERVKDRNRHLQDRVICFHRPQRDAVWILIFGFVWPLCHSYLVGCLKCQEIE